MGGRAVGIWPLVSGHLDCPVDITCAPGESKPFKITSGASGAFLGAGLRGRDSERAEEDVLDSHQGRAGRAPAGNGGNAGAAGGQVGVSHDVHVCLCVCLSASFIFHLSASGGSPGSACLD